MKSFNGGHRSFTHNLLCTSNIEDFVPESIKIIN